MDGRVVLPGMGLGWWSVASSLGRVVGDLELGFRGR